MATHDYVIANASGAAVRADLNNALAAIVSNNSSATEPATTYAYMLWYDTTAGQLKMRNAADDGWVVVPELDSSNRLLVGTTSAITNINTSSTDFAPRVQVVGGTASEGSLAIVRTATSPWLLFGAGASGTNIATDDAAGSISFTGYHTDKYYQAAQISCFVDGAPGANDMPGRLTFSTTADGASAPTERVRIDSDGRLLVGTSTYPTDTTNIAGGFGVSSISSTTAQLRVSAENIHAAMFKRTTSTGTVIEFRKDGSLVGSISVASSTTSYNTSSDYRLKENVIDITDGITRVKQLAPKRFNFIVDPDTTVDGFLAHEAQTVVPEAITGTHNEVEVWSEGEELPDGVSVGDNKLDEAGNTIPIYQGIDQSKLVPLLTAALQEAIAKIETLEAKVAALEAA